MVLPTCSYRDCYGSTVSRHRFPNPTKHLEMFNKWIVLCANKKLLHMPAHAIYSNSRVCRLHFMEEDFGTNNRLLRIACPRDHLSYPRLVIGESAVTAAAKTNTDIGNVLKEVSCSSTTSGYANVEEVQQSSCQPPSTTHILKEMRCSSNTGNDSKREEVQQSSFKPPSITQKRKQRFSPTIIESAAKKSREVIIMTQEETEIQTLEQEIVDLKAELKKKEKRLHELRFKKNEQNNYTTELTSEEISRYSRQMLVPEIGVAGQVALKKSKVLIVGTGGLGCPAALYLAAAGVGEITLVDNDEVDLTNLHRQILHTEADLGAPKVQSGYDTLTSLNSNIKITPVHLHATGTSLSKLMKENEYNVVVDGTDNVATRYLLNDLCVINKIPLVSGSALQMEGQLTVYNYNNGPCYRCLFPVPPPPESVTSCGDGGVLGVVPGIIGVLEALETIKIITGVAGVLSGRLLVFDGSDTTFSNIRLRNRKTNCEVCGTAPSITAPIDYEQFCGAKAHDKVENINILELDENVTIADFAHAARKDQLVVDVRPVLEYKMCHLPNSLNVPYSNIQKLKGLEDLRTEIMHKCTNEASSVYVICRRGNDSQRAVCTLKDTFYGLPVKFINVKGGLHAYSKMIDSTFPIY